MLRVDDTSSTHEAKSGEQTDGLTGWMMRSLSIDYAQHTSVSSKRSTRDVVSVTKIK